MYSIPAILREARDDIRLCARLLTAVFVLLLVASHMPRVLAAELSQRAQDAAATRTATRCADEAPGEFDAVCHRTLAPGDSHRNLQRAQRDRGLLAAYPDLDALFSMRDRQLADIDAQIELARSRMVSLHRELEQYRMLAGAASGPRASEAIAQARSRATAILAEDSLIHERRDEQALIRGRFERDARRLRFLLSDANPPAATGPLAAR